MRQFKYFVCVVSSTLLVFALPISSHADNVVIYGCYQKIHGQLRIVSSTDQCLASELPISWVAQSGQSYGPLTLYVNGVSGLDQPDYGKSASTPFKTISYALSQVPLLRNSEYRATINVAAGIYNESIRISLASVSIIGAGTENTTIAGNPSVPAVQVFSRGAIISGLNISGGNDGIYAESASLTVQNCVVQNSTGYAGIVATHNTTIKLTDTNVLSNNNVGIAIYRASSLDANNIFVKENKNVGIEVWYTATSRINNSRIEDNDSSGILVGSGSSVRLFGTKIIGNYLCGIDTTSSSTTVLRGGNIIQDNNISGIDWRGGVGVYQGSEFTITNDDQVAKDQIVGNSMNGIFLGNNSMSLIKDAIISNNQGNGIKLVLASSGQFENLVTISSNSGWGITCDKSVVGNTATVTGNALGNVNASCVSP